MADYNCAIRTNYFKVKDEDAFKALMSRVYGSENNVQFWDEVDSDGIRRFGFGCYGSIRGLRNENPEGSDVDDEDEDEDTYDAFIEELQKHIADDDACLIFESGHEKLRYVAGSVEVVTAKGARYLNIETFGVACAKELLGNPEWSSKLWY